MDALPSVLFSSTDINSSEENERQQRVREEVLRLPLDEQNFLRPPPHNSYFQWNQQISSQHMPLAMALLKEDKKLADMRFQLVPRK